MVHLLIENEAQILNVATLGLFLISLVKGAGPERASAGTLLGMILVDRSYHALFGPSPTFEMIDPWHLLLDTGGLIVFVHIALRANRVFPLVLAAAQLVAFTAHIVRMMVEPVTSLSYYLMYTMPFWFQLIILSIGIWRHQHRVKASGPYRSWREQYPGRSHHIGYS